MLILNQVKSYKIYSFIPVYNELFPYQCIRSFFIPVYNKFLNKMKGFALLQNNYIHDTDNNSEE